MPDDNAKYHLEYTDSCDQVNNEETKTESEGTSSPDIKSPDKNFARNVGHRCSHERIIESLPTDNFLNERFIMARRWFFILLCLSCGTFSLISIGLLSVSIPEIEKQFGLLSQDSGFISAVLDISASVCSIIISLLAKSKEVLWITVGLLIMSIGCVIFALPAILGINTSSKSGLLKLSEHNLCSLIRRVETSVMSSASNMNNLTGSHMAKIARIQFYAGFAIIGCGLAGIPLLGPVIIRKFYPTNLRSTRLAIFYFCTIAGPAFAYLIGKLFNSIPVNIKGGFTDDKFIGAWWLCFILGSVISAALTVSFAVIYRYYRDYYPTYQMDDEGVINKNQPLKETVNSLKRLSQNPCFVFITVANPLLQLLISGVGIFLPKYIEDQFGFDGSNAGLIAGISTIPGAFLGMFIGGFLIKYYKLNFNAICLFGLILSMIAAGITPCLLLGCPQPKLVYPGLKSDHINNYFLSNCVSKCHCSDNIVNKVCIESENILLSSPCLAGCQDYQTKNGSTEYAKCRCLKNSKLKAKRGKCNLQCPIFYFVITVLFALNLSLFSLYVPLTELTLRCIKVEDTVVAMGIQQLAQRLLGQVPGPLLVGYLIDNACSFWSNVAGNKSAQYCLFYDLYAYRRNMVFLTSPILLLVGICFGGAMYFRGSDNNR